MAQVVDFTTKKLERDPILVTLKNFSDDFDLMLTEYLTKVNIIDLIGVLSHRFGSLLALIEEKKELWPIYENILKRQADI